MCAMMDLKTWLREQGLSVRELAAELGVPLKTAQDWVYRGTTPSPENKARLDGFMRMLVCTHHWVIESPNGPVSQGVCQHCGAKRQFKNSTEYTGQILLAKR